MTRLRPARRSTRSRIVEGENGWPVLLADVPDSGTTRVSSTQRSGNKAHDVRSGRFGAGGGGGADKPATPANVDPLEFQRMLAAVRDAAREFDSMDEGDVREFLQGRAAAPDQVDVAAFIEQVRQQELNDLSDILDQQFRSTGKMKTGRRKVKISAPRGYVRRILRNLQPDEVDQLKHMLAARGHDEAEVNDWFDKKGFESIAASDNDTKVIGVINLG